MEATKEHEPRKINTILLKLTTIIHLLTLTFQTVKYQTAH